MSIDWTPWVPTVLSWLLTYLVHSTVLLGGAALSALALRARPELEEAVWKLALVGGLVTSLVQVAGGWQAPLGGLAASPPAMATSAAAAKPDPVGVGAVTAVVSAGPFPASFAAISGAPAAGSQAARLSMAWAGLAALLLARLLAGALALRRRLADRREIGAGRLRCFFERLLRRAGCASRVALSSSERISMPIATPAEVCVPGRVRRELPAPEQDVVVAHELAHVLRRDPLWQLAGQILVRLFFFQPLLIVAFRRLRTLAEFRCDDWAVAATGRPVTLARCLTRVASWTEGEFVAATAITGGGSRLARRVGRLLARDYPRPEESAPRWLRPAAAALLLAVVVWVPGVSLAGDPPAEPAAPLAPAAPAPAPAPLAAIASTSLAPEPPLPPAGELVTGPALAPPAPTAALAPLPAAPPTPALAPPAAAAVVPLPGAAIAPMAPATAIPAPGPAGLAGAPFAEPQWRLAAPVGDPAGQVELHEPVEWAVAELDERLVAERAALDEETARLAEEAERLEEEGGLTDEERRRIEAESRRLEAEAARLGRLHGEEMARLHEHARQMARETLPREELDRLRTEARQLAEEAGRLAAENRAVQELNHELAEQARQLSEQALQQAHESLERLRPELERLRLDAERERTELHRQLEEARSALHPELEALREHLRAQSAEVAAEARREAREALAAIEPELELLRQELGKRTEERDRLRAELEALRRERGRGDGGSGS